MTPEQFLVHQSRHGRGPDKTKRKPGSGLSPASHRPIDLGRVLASQLKTMGLKPTPEYRFHETRKWRIDVAFPEIKLAVEVDGAVHRIKSRFHGDIKKHQALFFMGWRLLRVSTNQVRSGEASVMIRDLIQHAR